MKILIISPHSECDENNNDRHCDRSAKKMAMRLFEISKKKYDTTLILADDLRSNIDYNREVAKNTKWRNNIRKFIESNRDEKILVLEIHSFPPEHPDIYGKTALVSTKKNKDMMIVFNELLKKNNFNIDLMLVSDVSHIMIDLKQYDNVTHHLIEFNEEPDKTDAFYSDDEICSLLSAGIATLYVKRIDYGVIIVILVIIIILLLYYIFYLGILVLNGDFHSLSGYLARTQLGERLKNLYNT